MLDLLHGRAHQERRQSARYRPLGYVGDGFHRLPVRRRCLDAASHGLRVWKPLRVGGAAGGFEPVLPARRLLAQPREREYVSDLRQAAE